LSLHDVTPPIEAGMRLVANPETNRVPDRHSSNDRTPRAATEAQVRAIRAIASKARISLASELEQSFGVQSPNQLTVAQASQLIDSLKQGLAPLPA